MSWYDLICNCDNTVMFLCKIGVSIGRSDCPANLGNDRANYDDFNGIRKGFNLWVYVFYSENCIHVLLW